MKPTSERTVSSVARSVYGVGINDADYPVTKSYRVGHKTVTTWRCPYNTTWKNMLKRCYSEAYQRTHPSYQGTTVCEGWLTFSNFKHWMQQQDWQGRELDKDLLGDGKIYSPATCRFIPTRLNGLLRMDYKNQGEYPCVYPNTAAQGYHSKISFDGKTEYLGTFATAREAYRTYLARKVELLELAGKDYPDIQFDLLRKVDQYREVLHELHPR